PTPTRDTRETNDMEPTGRNLVAGEAATGEGAPFRGVDPLTGAELDPDFREAGPEQVGRALEAAEAAFRVYGRWPGGDRARLLRAVAEEIEILGDGLLSRARLETGLPLERLRAERGRT